MANYAIIVAAGFGTRMGADKNKVFLLLQKEPIIARTIRIFNESSVIDRIFIVSRREDKCELEKIIKSNKFNKVAKIIDGGKERQDSVYNGLLTIKEAKEGDIIIIHNAANPFISGKLIIETIEAAKKYKAAVVGFKARDTIKEVDTEGFVVKTIERAKLWQIQTPQAIEYKLAMKAYNNALYDNFIGTDDGMLVERLGEQVKVVECPYENIKITSPNDLSFGVTLLRSSRIGFGMDSHRFVITEDKKLKLGGIEFEAEPGFMANSDGDVILHALFNAISQGLGEHSIGYYADKMYKNGIVDSKLYLDKILELMEERNYEIGNVGIMLEGKKPNILVHEKEIKKSLSNILGMPQKNIGITATTGEDLTPFGKGLGMQCFCVVTLNKIQKKCGYKA